MKKRILLLLTMMLLVVICLVPIRAVAKPSLKLSATKLSLNIDEKYNINLINKIAGSKYKWTTSNKKIVTVKNNGVVTASSSGTATITCIITTPKNGTKTLTCKITVKDTPAFFNNQLMAHAHGGFEGNIYNNTIEALEHSIENGFEFIETDVILTSDNELVAFHAWDEASYGHTGMEFNQDELIMNFDDFMNAKVQGKYNTVNTGQVIEYLKKNPNLYLDLDIKASDAKSARIIAKKIVELCDNDSTVLDRILIQFISEEAYYAIDEVYNFKYYQYFAFKRNVRMIDDVIEFCKDNGIGSIIINYNYLTDSLISKIKSNGLFIVTYTVDDAKIAKDVLSKGVDVVCTNFLTYEDIK